MSVNDWKDAEYAYCYALVHSGPTREVPAAAVRSYLDVQIASAQRDGRADVVAALEALKAALS
jgi:hypothetical protein